MSQNKVGPGVRHRGDVGKEEIFFTLRVSTKTTRRYVLTSEWECVLVRQKILRKQREAPLDAAEVIHSGSKKVDSACLPAANYIKVYKHRLKALGSIWLREAAVQYLNLIYIPILKQDTTRGARRYSGANNIFIVCRCQLACRAAQHVSKAQLKFLIPLHHTNIIRLCSVASIGGEWRWDV
ncbi:hypothetical protein ACJJTC_007755 [Scirpophaga incertulas]